MLSTNSYSAQLFGTFVFLKVHFRNQLRHHSITHEIAPGRLFPIREPVTTLPPSPSFGIHPVSVLFHDVYTYSKTETVFAGGGGCSVRVAIATFTSSSGTCL